MDKSLFHQLELYDLDDLAQLAGVRAASLRQCIREGRLRATRIGRKWKVTRENALAFLNGESRSGRELPNNGSAETPERDSRALSAARPEVAPTALATGPAGATAPGSPPQLLFLKPEDLDRLVSALAVHVERIERLSEQRDTELRVLVARLDNENARLRQELTAQRTEQMELLRSMTTQILTELASPDRAETERLRFRWLQDQLTALHQAAAPERAPRRRSWWPRWR